MGVAVSDVPKIADRYASNIVLPTINTGKFEGHSKKSTMYYCIEDFRKYDVYRISQQYKVHYLDIGGVPL